MGGFIDVKASLQQSSAAAGDQRLYTPITSNNPSSGLHGPIVQFTTGSGSPSLTGEAPSLSWWQWLLVGVAAIFAYAIVRRNL